MDRKYMQDTIKFLTETHKDIMAYTGQPEFANESLETQALFIASANSIASLTVSFQAFEWRVGKKEEEDLVGDTDSLVN